MLGQAPGRLLNAMVAPVLRGHGLADEGQVAAIARGAQLVVFLAALVLIQALFQALSDARDALRLLAARHMRVAVDQPDVLQHLVDHGLQLDLLPSGPAVVAKAGALLVLSHRLITLRQFVAHTYTLCPSER
ncbi:hypothetical protein D3C75_932660 [compost metagenome]